MKVPTIRKQLFFVFVLISLITLRSRFVTGAATSTPPPPPPAGSPTPKVKPSCPPMRRSVTEGQCFLMDSKNLECHPLIDNVIEIENAHCKEKCKAYKGCEGSFDHWYGVGGWCGNVGDSCTLYYSCECTPPK